MRWTEPGGGWKWAGPGGGMDMGGTFLSKGAGKTSIIEIGEHCKYREGGIILQ